MATSFDIAKAINKHTTKIAEGGSLKSEDIKELTSHLLDSTSELIEQGLSDEEAFMIAIKRLGLEHQISEEYSKVNPSVGVNRLWVVFFFGFFVISSAVYIIRFLFVHVYNAALNADQIHVWDVIGVSAIHVLCCIFIFLFVYNTQRLAFGAQRILTQQPLTMLFGSVALMASLMWVNRDIELDSTLTSIATIAIYEFRNPYIEFSFYLLVFSSFVGVLSLCVALKNPMSASMENVVKQPSIILLICAGIITEFLAASTRVLTPQSPELLSAIWFSIVYFVGAFSLTRYNEHSPFKYIIWYGLVGLLLEISVGVNGDLYRVGKGYDITTPYFVLALLVGLAGGCASALALRRYTSKRNYQIENLT